MKKNIVITLLYILLATSLNAQSHNEQVTVEGKYAPQIQKSERIEKTPDTQRRDFNIPSYEIDVEDFVYKHRIDIEPVSPLTYTYDKANTITSNFVKAGIGTRLSPDFLFHHYSNITRRSSLGLGIAHNSTWLGMKDFPDAKYMNNDFSVAMNNRFSQLQLHSHIDYSYDMYHMNADADFDSRRYIHSLNVKLAANNNKSSFKSLYDDFLLDYNFSGILGGMQENLLKFKAHIEHTNSWFRNRSAIQTLAIDINTDISNIKQMLFLVAANPHLDFDGDYYKLQLGLRVDARTNSLNKIDIYPDIKGCLYLFERNMEFYASLGGSTKINTLKEILAENPFVISDLTKIGEFDYERTMFDFQGGLKFKTWDKVSGHIGIRYRKIDNHIFYVSSLEQAGTFDIITNDCHLFNFNIDLQANINEKIKIIGDFAYNKYDFIIARLTCDVPITITHAWYKPEVEFTLKGIYDLNEKWNFKLATYFEGTRYALINYEETQKLKPICDVQLGCDYHLDKNLSFYAEIKNLIHNKYQIYYDYPSYGIQAFVGFKYRFM